MLKAMAGMDPTARATATDAWNMASAISGAMGGGPTTPDYTAWIGAQFDAQFLAHNLISAPVARTLSFSTAYQLTTPTKPGFVGIQVELVTTVAVGSPQANTVVLYTGPTTGVATGTGTGTIVADTYRSDLTVTLISLGFTGRQFLKANVPVGHYFAIVRTVGSGTSIVSSFDQSKD